ncbi:MAG: maltose acetyltransferase [Gammaproteobacteria bacterium]|nr:MAG: maltose acetyltransferase [Gammaproteobacteria bacterium]
MKGLLFDSNSSENRARRDLVHDRCRAYTRSPSKGHFKKLKTLFNKCGNDVRIEYGFHCDYGNKISFGEGVYLNINCTILDGGDVIIGDDVLIGPNVQFITVNHEIQASARLHKKAYVQSIKIGNKVWIGAGVIILPGAIIEDNVVVGAGSIVTGLLKSNRLYTGNPAQLNKEIE